MNWDEFAGNWKQFAGKVKDRLGRLVGSNRVAGAGRREQVVGMIQEREGYQEELADHDFNAFAKASKA